jgi:hypothetical protein
VPGGAAVPGGAGALPAIWCGVPGGAGRAAGHPLRWRSGFAAGAAWGIRLKPPLRDGTPDHIGAAGYSRSKNKGPNASVLGRDMSVLLRPKNATEAGFLPWTEVARPGSEKVNGAIHSVVEQPVGNLDLRG